MNKYDINIFSKRVLISTTDLNYIEANTFADAIVSFYLNTKKIAEETNDDVFKHDLEFILNSLTEKELNLRVDNIEGNIYSIAIVLD